MRARRAVIKEEYVQICGDYISALILDKLIEWDEQIKDFMAYLDSENQRREKALEPHINFDPEGWIYRSEEQLSKETLLGVSEKTIARSLAKLNEAGLLEKRKNPERPWERATQWRPNLSAIALALEKAGWRGEFKMEAAAKPKMAKVEKKQAPPQIEGSPKAKELANFSFELIKKVHGFDFPPKIQQKSVKMFDRFLKKGYKFTEMRDAILWVMSDTVPRNGFCWSQVVESPLKLSRRNGSQILYMDKFISLMKADPGFAGYHSEEEINVIPAGKVKSKFRRIANAV